MSADDAVTEHGGVYLPPRVPSDETPLAAVLSEPQIVFCLEFPLFEYHNTSEYLLEVGG